VNCLLARFCGVLLLRGQTLRSLTRTVTPQKMMLAGSPSPKSLETAPQRWTKVKNSARRFGHRAVRSQKPQTCFSRDLWPPMVRWLNLPFVQQSLSFTFFHNLQGCGILCGGIARDVFGVELRKVSPCKVSPRKRLRKAPEKLEEKEDKASWPGNKPE